MEISDQLSPINLDALKDAARDRAPELTTLVRCIEALLGFQGGLFGLWKPNIKILNERQFPYLIYYFSGKIRYIANGLFSQIAQGNEFSASILLRSLMENASHALFISKCTGDAEHTHDLLLAASCKRQIYNLLQIANPDVQVDLNQVTDKHIENVKRKEAHFAPLRFQMNTLWYALNRINDQINNKIVPETDELIALLLLKNRLINNIEKAPFGNIEKVIKVAREKVRDQALADALDYDHQYRISSGDVHTIYQNDRYLFASKDRLLCSSNYDMLDMYLFLACEYLYISCDSVIAVIPNREKRAQLYNRLDESVIDMGTAIKGIMQRIKKGK